MSLVTNRASSKTPLKMSLSPLWKLPLTLYAVIAVPAETSYLRNPVAPLDSPLMWVDVVRVTASFNEISEYV